MTIDIIKLAENTGKSTDTVMRNSPNGDGTRMLLNGYNFTPEELQAFADAILEEVEIKIYEASAESFNEYHKNYDTHYEGKTYGLDIAASIVEAMKGKVK